MTKDRDPRERFREALEKKRTDGKPQIQNSGKKSKVQGGQSNAGGPKMFRRKSGPS